MRKLKLLMVLAVCIGAAVSVFGAGEQVGKGIFMTTGPDHYADGTEVLQGETYALVWRHDADAAFQGFHEDGSLVDKDDVLVNADEISLPGWKASANHNLNKLRTQFDLSYLASGALKLYVLDTRRYQASYAYDENGNIATVTTNITVAGLGSVQGCAEVAGIAQITGTSIQTQGSGLGSYLVSLLDQKIIPSPVITGMRIEGDTVVLTVKSTKSDITYNAVGGTTLGQTGVTDAPKPTALAPVNGALTEADSIELRIKRNKDAKSEFFKVIRNPMN